MRAIASINVSSVQIGEEKISMVEKIIRNITYWSALLFILIMAACSLFSTTYFRTDYAEVPLYRADLWPLLLIAAAGVWALFRVICRLLDRYRITGRSVMAVLAVYSLLFSTGWVLISNSVPTADANTISIIAAEFAQGTYTGLMPGAYLYRFPHQIGYTAYVEFIYRLFGAGNYLAVQLINGLWICLILFCLYGISGKLFGEKSARNTALLLFFCFPLYFYATFAYGNIPSLVLSLAALWCMITYVDSRHPSSLTAAGALAGLAVLLKSNSLIFAVAMLIAAVFAGNRISWKRRLLAAAAFLVLMQLPGICVKQMYALRADTEVGNHGIPKTAWIAMGLQDGDLAPGWYNDYVMIAYQKYNNDNLLVAEDARQEIDRAVRSFVSDPVYGMKFFGEKFISQWNDPGYQCFMVGHEADAPRGWLADSMYYGTFHEIVMGFMNGYQFVILAFAAAFLTARRKKCDLRVLLPGMIVVGGVLFHLVWEAKCQYALPYFAVMVPYAGAGVDLRLLE